MLPLPSSLISIVSSFCLSSFPDLWGPHHPTEKSSSKASEQPGREEEWSNFVHVEKGHRSLVIRFQGNGKQMEARAREKLLSRR